MGNKFGQLHEFCKDNLDIILITETKLQSSFSRMEFLIPGYCSPDRLVCNHRRGEILTYIREDMPPKHLVISFEHTVEAKHFRKKK